MSEVMLEFGRRNENRINGELTQLSLVGFHVPFQEPIDHAVEFHEALVFAQVVFRFAQETIYFSIGTTYTDLAWFL